MLALPCLYFAPAVFGGKGFAMNDIISFFYPFKYVAGEMYRTLNFYQWDPYLFGGMPTGAELQTALYYPLNLVFAVFSPMKGITLFIVLHIFLSSLFMYLYLREIKLSKLASLFGALAFTYNGYYLMHVDQLSILSVSCWLPLIFLLIEKTSKDSKNRRSSGSTRQTNSMNSPQATNTTSSGYRTA